jgi:protoporphyrinogen oxidase
MNTEEKTVRADVIVLGAGLTGLAAAEGVLRYGEKPLVIEKEERVGGLCASVRKGGFIFDFGGHRFLPHHKETADFARSLFDDDSLLLRSRKSQIYLNGKFLQYPPEPLDILKKLGVLTSLNCALQGLFARVRHFFLKKQEISLKDWLINRFGKKLYDIYFGPYSAKLWGIDPSLISSEWAPQRVSVSSIGVVIANLLKPRSGAIKTYAQKFLYPVGGIGRMPEKMADRVINKGGRIFKGLNVVSVSRKDRGFVIEAANTKGEKRIFFSSKIISSIPLPEFISVMRPYPTQEIQEAAGHLKFRSVRFLNLMLDVSEVTKNTWLYIPEEKYIFFRIQEFNKWCPRNAPKGKNALTLEVACQKEDEVWTMSDEALLHLCLRDLKKMGIDLSDKVLGYFSTFAEYAYPFYSLGYKRHLYKIYRFIEGIDAMMVCGRQGLFRYVNMDSAIENGFQAAGALFDLEKRSRFLKDQEGNEYLEANLYPAFAEYPGFARGRIAKK